MFDRRQLLAGIGAAAGAALQQARPQTGGGRDARAPRTAAPPDLLKEALRYKKTDSHCHLGFGETAKLLEAADRLGIDKLAVSIPRGPQPEEFRASNDRVLSAMKEHPDRLLGQCFINPVYQKESIEEIVRCVNEGMIGPGELYDQVKISDPLYYPIIEKCIEMKAPLLMHCRADLGLLRKGYRTAALPNTSIPDDFAAIGRRYPEAILIQGHIGGGGDWEWMCKTIREVPNVYLDTSGSVSDEGMVDFAVRALGVERLLFATDLNFESGVGKILAAKLTEQQRRAIFYDNYAGILERSRAGRPRSQGGGHAS